MTNRFLISVAAAALVAGTAFANAQGTMGRDAGSAGSTAQQGAPSSEHGGAMHRDSGGMKAESPKGAQSGMKADSTDKAEPRGKSAQDSNRMQGEKSKSMSADDSAKDKDGAKGDKAMKAEGRDHKSGATSAEGRDGKMDTQKGAASTDSKSQTTTGTAATRATAAPPAEKRTEIVSAIKTEKIQETTNVNFNVSVGAVVPTSVRFHPIPARIVEIYPQWRGYQVILVKGRYVIVEPQTHEIVYIIEG